MTSVRTTAVSRVMPHRMIQEGISPITSCTSSLRNSISFFFSIIISFVCIFSRSFALMQKNQKIKASSASLLTSCTPLFASQTRAPRSNSDAPGRSVPVVRFTLTSRGQSYPASNFQLFLSPRHVERNSPLGNGVETSTTCFNSTRPNGRGAKQIHSGASRNLGCLSAEREFPRF